MDKPKCRLCGSKHWSNEPHEIVTASLSPGLKISFAPSSKSAGPVTLNGQTLYRDGKPLLAGDLVQGQIVKVDLTPERPAFDRKAYQRELMRKRRAKAKTNPPVT